VASGVGEWLIAFWAVFSGSGSAAAGPAWERVSRDAAACFWAGLE
jgi:hypothetical protein